MGDEISMRFIKDWAELAKVEDSETHRLEIVIEDGNGWVVSKATGKPEEYLSTHTFYGEKHLHISKKLQDYGFNVELSNWDAQPSNYKVIYMNDIFTDGSSLLTKKINDNEYEVYKYDDFHIDYLCGHIKRRIGFWEWMFYPIDGNKPLTCGDLVRFSDFIRSLNG